MFLCEECHKAARCDRSDLESESLFPGSYGRCEDCGKGDAEQFPLRPRPMTRRPLLATRA